MTAVAAACFLVGIISHVFWVRIFRYKKEVGEKWDLVLKVGCCTIHSFTFSVIDIMISEDLNKLTGWFLDSARAYLITLIEELGGSFQLQVSPCQDLHPRTLALKLCYALFRIFVLDDESNPYSDPNMGLEFSFSNDLRYQSKHWNCQ